MLRIENNKLKLVITAVIYVTSVRLDIFCFLLVKLLIGVAIITIIMIILTDSSVVFVGQCLIGNARRAQGKPQLEL